MHEENLPVPHTKLTSQYVSILTACGVEQLRRDKRSFVLILHLLIFLILNTCVFVCDI